MKKIPLRDEISEKDKWDLTPLFSSDDEWEQGYAELESRIAGYAEIRKIISRSASELKKAIEFDLETERLTDRVFTYAHLKNDEDKTNQRYSGIYQRAMNLYVRLSEASSFIVPAIQSIPDATMASFLQGLVLEDYRFYLEKILRMKPHTLSEEIEEMLAMSGEVMHAPSEFFSQLDNADMKFGTIRDETGAETELSHANFSSFLMNYSRDTRREAFRLYYKAYDDHKNCISSALASSVKRDNFIAKVRKHRSCLEAALFSDKVSADVYDRLIEAVKNNVSSMKEYLLFRKKALGIDELHIYDTYVPVVPEVEFNMPYEEAVETCCEALKPLGDQYVSLMRDGLSGGWVDRYENRGKRSGAYSSGCYDSPPYILMNYRPDSMNSLFTLAHEAGHSMHSLYSNRAQPFVYSGYSIFVAEVASTFNETLLAKHLLEKYSDDPRMSAYILNREIDDIRSTLQRQTMFAEFEKIIHTAAEENRALTLDFFTDTYRSLLETYFGGEIVIDDQLPLEALRIPHFYSPFYVYKYATGISAAIALARKVITDGNPGRDKYINFLKTGSSAYPVDQLSAAGVDMREPEPVNEALAYFAELTGRLIEIYPAAAGKKI